MRVVLALIVALLAFSAVDATGKVLRHRNRHRVKEGCNNIVAPKDFPKLDPASKVPMGADGATLGANGAFVASLAYAVASRQQDKVDKSAIEGFNGKLTKFFKNSLFPLTEAAGALKEVHLKAVYVLKKPSQDDINSFISDCSNIVIVGWTKDKKAHYSVAKNSKETTPAKPQLLLDYDPLAPPTPAIDYKDVTSVLVFKYTGPLPGGPAAATADTVGPARAAPKAARPPTPDADLVIPAKAGEPVA